MNCLEKILNGLTLIGLLGAASPGYAEEPKKEVPVVSVTEKYWLKPSDACQEFPAYEEVMVNNENELTKDKYHCVKGKPEGKQTQFGLESGLNIDKYYSQEGHLDLAVLSWAGTTTKSATAYRVLNSGENLAYDFHSLLGMHTGIRCDSDRFDDDFFPIPSKECMAQEWQFHYKDSPPEHMEFEVDGEYIPLAEDHLQKVKGILEEISQKEKKYGTSVLESQKAYISRILGELKAQLEKDKKNQSE